MSSALAGTLFGLLTAFCWAGADFSAKRAVAESDSLAVTLGMQLTGAVILAALAVILLIVAPHWLVPYRLRPDASLWVWGPFSLAVGWSAISGVALAFRSYRLAPLAVASPVVNTKGFFAALLAVAVLGEGASAIMAAGALLCLCGVAAMGWKGEAGGGSFFRPGVPTAILSALGYGAAMTFTKPLVDHAGQGLAVVGVRLGALTLLVPMVLVQLGAKRALPERREWGRLFGIGAFDAVGHLAIVVGLAHAPAFIVVTLAALTPVFTVALALLVLKERLGPRQWAGFVLVALGIVLLAGTNGW